MITEGEKERIAMAQAAIERAMAQFNDVMGDGLPEGFFEMISGTVMAVVDALYAIREGEAWRGISDPAEIARQLLREASLGE